MSASTTLIRVLQATGFALLATVAAIQPAHAGTLGGWTRSSTVTDSVVDNGNGTWTYNYRVNNTSRFDEMGPDREPILVDWELPWFGDAGITNITSPHNWAYNIETIGMPNPSTGWDGVAAWQTPGDPFYAGPGSPFTTATEVLHWYNLCWAQFNANANAATGFQPNTAVACEFEFDNAIFPDGSLGGFGFDADFGPTGAPYQASWAFMSVRTGDPAFPLGGIPNSPALNGVIPEPGVLGLLVAALAAGGAVARRRRSR